MSEYLRRQRLWELATIERAAQQHHVYNDVCPLCSAYDPHPPIKMVEDFCIHERIFKTRCEMGGLFNERGLYTEMVEQATK